MTWTSTAFFQVMWTHGSVPNNVPVDNTVRIQMQLWSDQFVCFCIYKWNTVPVQENTINLHSLNQCTVSQIIMHLFSHFVSTFCHIKALHVRAGVSVKQAELYTGTHTVYVTLYVGKIHAYDFLNIFCKLTKPGSLLLSIWSSTWLTKIVHC